MTTEPDFDSYVRFEEWTKTRVPFFIGTNSGSEPLAFQNWRRFKEAFIPELVARAVNETCAALGRPVLRCLDPCAGSGTTPLTCQFLGVEPLAIEVNPFLADLIESKLQVVDEALVASRCAEVIAKRRTIDPRAFYAAAPPTFVEPGVAGRYLFQDDVAERLASLLASIDEIPEPAIKRLLRVLLGTAALEVCNATVSGKGRRYRRNWKARRRLVSELDVAFVQAVEAAVFDVTRYARRKTLAYDLRRGDARTVIEDLPDFDLAVFSPPYPNSFDYTDVYNIELWALGYLRENIDNTKLRKSTLRSHVQIKRDYSAEISVPIVEKAIKELREADNLWNRNIPDMIGAYFSDLATIIKGARRKMPEGGRVYMVVGDSKYAGIEIPVAVALTQISPNLGFAAIGAEPFRSMRTSPQQGGRAELPETLLTLEAG